jgi:hypothetical protein
MVTPRSKDSSKNVAKPFREVGKRLLKLNAKLELTIHIAMLATNGSEASTTSK